jgi:hypothetical protein
MVGCAALLTACGDDSQRQREQERTEQRNKELGLLYLGHPTLALRVSTALPSTGRRFWPLPSEAAEYVAVLISGKAFRHCQLRVHLGDESRHLAIP